MTQAKKNSYVGKRVVATLIDYTFIFIFSFWYIMTFGEVNSEGGRTVNGLPALVPMIVWFLYFVVVEKYCSATLGHEIVKLKIVSIDGNKLSFAQVLKRRLADALEISWCFGLIAFILAKSTENNQRLGDILARTIVVDKAYEESLPKFDFDETSKNKTATNTV